MSNGRRTVRTQVTETVIATWLASLRSDHTRAAYATDLAAFNGWCSQRDHPLLEADSTAIDQYRVQRESANASVASVARGMSAINGFFKFAADNGFVVSPIRRQRVSAVPERSPTVPLSNADRSVLLRGLGSHPTKAQVLVAMLLLDGIKLDEVLRLDAEHVVGRPPTMSAVIVRPDGEAVIVLNPDTSAAVVLHLRHHPHRALLTSDSRSRDEGSRLSRHGAGYLIKQVGQRSGLDAPLTANSLRRTHVIHAHRHGTALDDIRRRLGHDDIRTTRRYLQDPDPQASTHNAVAAGSRRRPKPRR